MSKRPPYVKVGDRVMHRADFDKSTDPAVVRVRRKIILFDRIAALVNRDDPSVAVGALINALTKVILENSDSPEEIQRQYEIVTGGLHTAIAGNLLLASKSNRQDRAGGHRQAGEG